MASNSPMECGVCNEKFDDSERCPRILPCSHHLCTHCISRLLENNSQARKCPFCRAPICAQSATDVMINHGLLDLIKFMSSHYTAEGKDLPSGFGSSMRLKEKIRDLKEAARVTCEDHMGSLDNKLALFENFLQCIGEKIADIQQQSEVIENILVKYAEVVKKNELNEQRLNGKRDSLSLIIGEICEKRDMLKKMTDELEEVTSSKEAASLIDDAEEMCTNIESWMVTLQDTLCKDENDSKVVSKDIAATKTIIDTTMELFINCISQREPRHNSEATDAIIKDIFKGSISVSSLLSMNDPIKFLINREKVYAVQNQGGKRRSARVTIMDDKVFIHHLKDSPPPRDSYSIQYSEILEHVKPSSKRSFLEFYIGVFSIGRILINLVPDAPPAENFSMLCTGELGPGYAGTKILEIWRKFSDYESLRMGDYEHNNGSGGKALLPGFQLRKEDHVCPWVAGTIWCFREDLPSQFCIATKNQSSTTCFSAFGRVEEGMDVIEKVLTFCNNIQGVTVKDSGLVLIPTSS